jgi:hypothetical protein
VTPGALAAATSTIRWGWAERRSGCRRANSAGADTPDIVLELLLDCRSHSADVTLTQGPVSKPRVLITQTLGTILTRAACTN